MGGRIRVFITSYQSKRNLAVLLELQDYSPVTLLKSIYGPTAISKATVLQDRNQTIALYVSPNPTSRFSSTLTAHGSGRWIHRDSTFDPGAYLLVTLPFPQRKAVDMKVKLQDNWLEFSIPESEKLYSNLALNAILPEKIMHLGVDKSAEIKNKDNKIYSKIRILHFKYFMTNNTYLAAAESHLTMEEELAEYMPSPLIQAGHQQQQQQQQQAFQNKKLLKQGSDSVKNNDAELSQITLTNKQLQSVKNDILVQVSHADPIKSNNVNLGGGQVALNNNKQDVVEDKNQELVKTNIQDLVKDKKQDLMKSDILGVNTRIDSVKYNEPAKNSAGIVSQVTLDNKQETVKQSANIFGQAIQTNSAGKSPQDNKEITTANTGGPSLEAFFANEPETSQSFLPNNVADNDKIVTNHEIKPLKGDTLTLAQATGLL